MNASPQTDQQLTDERLEAAIESTRQALLAAKTPAMRHDLNGQMTHLISQRSPEQRARMARERGLPL